MTLLLSFVDSVQWDPHLRGLLSVIVGVVVLFGSVYLLLATNSGPRIGMLLALTGLFGWFVIMGLFWWITGKGWVGSDPSWQEVEVVIGEHEAAVTEALRDLQDLDETPELADVGRAAAIPGYEGVAPEEVAAEAGLAGDWTYLPTSNRARGDAEAAATAVLTGGENDLVGFESTEDYRVVAAYEVGGKPRRASDSIVDRVANRITNTLRITHPVHYAAVVVQPTVELPIETGEAPPLPMLDEQKELTTVLLVRDLGFRRLRPALFTIFSTIIFAILCYQLHVRDKFEMQQRALASSGAE
jgi:hypothetical protein